MFSGTALIEVHYTVNAANKDEAVEFISEMAMEEFGDTSSIQVPVKFISEVNVG